MEDKQEIDALKAQSRWSGKRVVLLYWMAIMFLGTGFAIGLGKTVLEPQYTAGTSYDHSTIAEPWHPDDCSGCHGDADGSGTDEFDEWNATGHADIGRSFTFFNNGSDYVNIGGYGDLSAGSNVSQATFESTCSHCMTTRQNATAPTNTSYWDLGVTCAACHDAGSVNHTSSNCGQCHTDSFNEWNVSAHQDSLNNFAGRSNPSSCLKCQVGQASWQVNFNTTGVAGFNYSDPNDVAAWVPISCPTCHDPHDSTNEVQLRTEDSTTLCGTCHGTAYSTHHQSNATFFSGWQPHQELGCTDCHGYTLVLGHDGVTMEPHVNHTWVIDDAGYACNQSISGMECHSDGVAQLVLAEEIQNHTRDLITVWEEAWEEANATYYTAMGTANVDMHAVDFVLEMLDESEHLAHLVDYDHSVGFHNPGLAEGRLTAALELAHMADALAQEAIDNAAAPHTEYVTVTEPTTVFETTTVTVTSGFLLLSTLGLLGLVILNRRRRR
ncbi:MAG: cytochrome c3 family protein [Candidatus Hodarchaeales archaeon]